MTLLLIMSLMLSGCGSKPAETEKKAEDTEQKAAEDEVIRIGVYEPMTGASAAGGQMTVEGIELAKEMYPEVLGKEVKLFIVDNKTDKTESANAVARLD
jgi:branched-chain amino acid transport system substrate-binding protein